MRLRFYTGCNLGDYRIAKMLTDALAENYDINGFESSIDRTMTKLQEGLGDNIGKTVFHEVEHYFDSVVNTTELNKERRNEIIRFAAPSIGYLGVCIGYGPMVAPHTPLNDTLETAAVQVGLLAAMIGGGIYHNKIGNFKRYRSRSSEVRARLAEEEAPDGFVVFHPKSDFNHPETVPKQSLMKQIIDRASGS